MTGQFEMTKLRPFAVAAIVTLCLCASVEPALATVQTSTSGKGVGIEEGFCRAALTPQTTVSPQQRRGISATDLAELRDIGAWDDYQSGASPLAVSPDGHWVAFVVRRAIPARNGYCVGLYAVSVGAGAEMPRLLDVGGEYIRRTSTLFGMVGIPTGMPLVVSPQWSSDGKRIAYLRQDAQFLRVWVAELDGSGARAVSPTNVRPTAFRWADDPGTLRVEGQSTDNLAEDVKPEALTGYRYDDRFWPIADSLPHAVQALPSVTMDIACCQPVDDSTAPIPSRRTPIGPTANAGSTRDDHQRRPEAWLKSLNPNLIASPQRLHARIEGRESTCDAAECAGVVAFWWTADRRSIVYLAMAGPAKSLFKLFRWSPDGGSPTPLLTTPDVISGCQMAHIRLVCNREGSIQPRIVVAISVADGRVETIFDPNPEFRGIELSKPKRLFWSNRFGIATFGDLILPVGSRRRHPLPLVIVQYDSRGFLRGGTGDEYPIQALVARGFAVLSFNRPMDFGVARSSDGVAVGNRASVENWNDRWSVQSSLETVIGILLRQGLIDRSRIAITGLSDGSSAASFALIHSDLFSAAIFSTCCQDPVVQGAMMGPQYARSLNEQFYPPALDPVAGAWSEISLRHHAATVKASILIQASDREFRMALPTYQLLMERGVPIELYVFPDEYHVKWQPAHRLAIYERVISWLSRWAYGHDSGGR